MSAHPNPLTPTLSRHHPQRPAQWRALLSRVRGAGRAPVEHDEDGAVLILALIFLVTVGLVITALLNWAGTSLAATGSFPDRAERGIRGHRRGESGRPEHPLFVRRRIAYTIPQQPCAGALRHLRDTQRVGQVDVYCTMVWQPYSSNTRVFTYSACTSTSVNNNSPADCAAKPLLQAQFAFYDYPSAASISSSPPRVHADCFERIMRREHDRAQLALEPGGAGGDPRSRQITGPITGGTTVTIQGTGFTGGETVNFVQQNPTSGAYNPAVPADHRRQPVAGLLPPDVPPGDITRRHQSARRTTSLSPRPEAPARRRRATPTPYVPTFTYAPATPTVNGHRRDQRRVDYRWDSGAHPRHGLLERSNPQFPTQVFFCPDHGSDLHPRFGPAASPRRRRARRSRP